MLILRKQKRGPLAQIGEVRVHAGVRRVKIQMDGPIAGRWMDYARWWWIRNRGPVPRDKRVCHLDGDQLNDDPANFGLLTAGDVVFMAHDRDPAMSRRNYAAAAKATARANRDRGFLRRMREWFPQRWYAIDLERRLIVCRHERQEWKIYARAGSPVDASNWRFARSVAIGWPGAPYVGAMILSCLRAKDCNVTGSELVEAVSRQLDNCGWGSITRSGLLQAAWHLRKRHWLRVTFGGPRIRVGVREVMFRSLPAALAASVPPSPYIAFRGEQLIAPRFSAFTRLEDWPTEQFEPEICNAN